MTSDLKAKFLLQAEIAGSDPLLFWITCKGGDLVSSLVSASLMPEDSFLILPIALKLLVSTLSGIESLNDFSSTKLLNLKCAGEPGLLAFLSKL